METSPPLRTIPDFPRPGIQFIDITPWLADGGKFQAAIRELSAFARELGAEAVAAPEARGFLIGAPIAAELGIGFLPVRKPGRLPFTSIRQDYELEYGTAALELHVDAIRPGQRVLVVDDLLATGGTVTAAMDLIRSEGGVPIGLGFLVELTFLSGRQRLGDMPVRSLVQIGA
jgi:adenine phosphoribosyltransferase